MRLELPTTPFDEVTYTKVDVWYDHDLSLWTVHRKNDTDDVIGESQYAHYKADAVKIARQVVLEAPGDCTLTVETRRG
jgi:hypothetical protein